MSSLVHKFLSQMTSGSYSGSSVQVTDIKPTWTGPKPGKALAIMNVQGKLMEAHMTGGQGPAMKPVSVQQATSDLQLAMTSMPSGWVTLVVMENGKMLGPPQQVPVSDAAELVPTSGTGRVLLFVGILASLIVLLGLYWYLQDRL